MKRLLNNIYENTKNVEYENIPENLNKIQHQSLIAAWACKFEIGSCKERALVYFQAWMKTKYPDVENP